MGKYKKLTSQEFERVRDLIAIQPRLGWTVLEKITGRSYSTLRLLAMSETLDDYKELVKIKNAKKTKDSPAEESVTTVPEVDTDSNSEGASESVHQQLDLLIKEQMKTNIYLLEIVQMLNKVEANNPNWVPF